MKVQPAEHLIRKVDAGIFVYHHIVGHHVTTYHFNSKKWGIGYYQDWHQTYHFKVLVSVIMQLLLIVKIKDKGSTGRSKQNQQ